MIENELEKMINILLSDKRETIVRFEQERFNVKTCGKTPSEIVCTAMLSLTQVLIMREDKNTAAVTEQLAVMNGRLKIIVIGKNSSYSKGMVRYISESDDMDIVNIVKMTVVDAVMNDELILPEMEQHRINTIRTALSDLGLTANYTGYKYVDIILNLLSGKKISDQETLCKSIYPMIAKKNGSTRERVERCIRTVINSSWKKTSTGAKAKYFGLAYINKEKAPSNKEFLYVMSENIDHEMQKFKCTIRDSLLYDTSRQNTDQRNI